MNYIDALVLGAIEGITEFLPISSTGHLILASHLLGLPDGAFLTSFEIAIQLGAICAVLLLFWKSFLNIEILKRLLAGFIPTAIVGLTLYSFIKQHLLGNELIVVIALAVGGVVLIVFELLHKEREDAPEGVETITYRQAMLVGLAQSVAVIPGVSRSAATILGGLMLGMRRTTIVEFSFLLAVPTMGAAVALDILKNYQSFAPQDFGYIGVGFVTAFVVALVAVKFLLRFVRTSSFIPFGVYRIVIAVLFFYFVLY
jgi:undecaprenyl-diphosphatase